MRVLWLCASAIIKGLVFAAHSIVNNPLLCKTVFSSVIESVRQLSVTVEIPVMPINNTFIGLHWARFHGLQLVFDSPCQSSWKHGISQ